MDAQKSCLADSASASARASQANLSALASPPQEYGCSSASSSISLESGLLSRGSRRGRTHPTPLPAPARRLDCKSARHASRASWIWAMRSRLAFRHSRVQRRPRCHRAPRAGQWSSEQKRSGFAGPFRLAAECAAIAQSRTPRAREAPCIAHRAAGQVSDRNFPRRLPAGTGIAT